MQAPDQGGVVKVQFLGATETVTGSKYLVECGKRARVLVDCGLFQGRRELRRRNWASLPVTASSIDAVVLTHAHIDHTGYLPALVRRGFAGNAYCTAATRDLVRLLLPDCGHIQEEDARHALKWGYSKHREPRALFTRLDAMASLEVLRSVAYRKKVQVADSVWATFYPAGHILGSSFVVLEDGGSRLLFSGDVGRPDDLLMLPPDPIVPVDAIVCESTYGDRLHQKTETEKALGEVLAATISRGGNVVVPAFAVGRTQALLYLLSRLRRDTTVPYAPVYLDSPMAISASDVYCRHHREHRLDDDACRAACSVAKYLRTPEESKRLVRSAGPYVVISASGMATGGRVLHHLKNALPDPRNTVLLTGYQAAGTRGRFLVEGSESVKIHGEKIRVRAAVDSLDHLSAHADRDELIGWLRTAPETPRQFLVTHGECSVSQSFARHVSSQLGWQASVPKDGEVIEIG